MNQIIKGICYLRSVLAIALLSVSAMSLAVENTKEPTLVADVKPAASPHDVLQWKKFHSVPGKCKVSFPQNPEHVKQVMTLKEDNCDMQYDVYVSTEQNKDAVYLVLIAQYPDYVNESCAELSLECFLNGILTQHPDNELIFADLIEIQGHKGMDFFIKTKGLFFKGRAVMSGSNLYLIAMECEEKLYKEHRFNFFINSFELVK